MKIQFILRESTIKDIQGPWVTMGNDDNCDCGGFTFDDLKVMPFTDGGLIYVETSDSQYIYNVSDFYRIKISGKLND